MESTLTPPCLLSYHTEDSGNLVEIKQNSTFHCLCSETPSTVVISVLSKSELSNTLKVGLILFQKNPGLAVHYWRNPYNPDRHGFTTACALRLKVPFGTSCSVLLDLPLGSHNNQLSGSSDIKHSESIVPRVGKTLNPILILLQQLSE